MYSSEYLLCLHVVDFIIRLAFHDCVGGCDGCLNVNDADNAGFNDLSKFFLCISREKSFVSQIADYKG